VSIEVVVLRIEGEQVSVCFQCCTFVYAQLHFCVCKATLLCMHSYTIVYAIILRSYTFVYAQLHFCVCTAALLCMHPASSSFEGELINPFFPKGSTLSMCYFFFKGSLINVTHYRVHWNVGLGESPGHFRF